MPAKKGATRLAGRNAINGRFVPIDYARRHPKTTVVERIKKVTKKRKG